MRTGEIRSILSVVPLLASDQSSRRHVAKNRGDRTSKAALCLCVSRSKRKGRRTLHCIRRTRAEQGTWHALTMLPRMAWLSRPMRRATARGNEWLDVVFHPTRWHWTVGWSFQHKQRDFSGTAITHLFVDSETSDGEYHSTGPCLIQQKGQGPKRRQAGAVRCGPPAQTCVVFASEHRARWL